MDVWFRSYRKKCLHIYTLVNFARDCASGYYCTHIATLVGKLWFSGTLNFKSFDLDINEY